MVQCLRNVLQLLPLVERVLVAMSKQYLLKRGSKLWVKDVIQDWVQRTVKGNSSLTLFDYYYIETFTC